jgi:hypothetical protein
VIGVPGMVGMVCMVNMVCMVKMVARRKARNTWEPCGMVGMVGMVEIHHCIYLLRVRIIISFQSCFGPKHSLASHISRMAPKIMLPNGYEASEWPYKLRVTADMVQDAQTSFEAMFEECPKVRFTVPLQDHIGECIFEADMLKTKIEEIPENTLSSEQEIHDRNGNINHRCEKLMANHELLKTKVADVKGPPRGRQVKRHLTDEDVQEAVEEEVPDTQPLAEDTQPLQWSDFEDSQVS